MTSATSEIVADPVAHISISGVHGRDELNERLARAAERRDVRKRPAAMVLVGAIIGATLAYLLKR